MTSPYVAFAQPTPPPSRSAWPVVRAVLAVLAMLSCLPLALFAAFWAAITWSGCFLSCEEPNRIGGLAAAALAVGLLTSGPLATAGLYRSRTWLWIAAGTAAVASIVMVGVLGAAN